MLLRAILLSILLLVSTVGVARGQATDVVAVSPDNYKVLLENDNVRVLEYSLKPGERDAWHTHPAKVSWGLTGGKVRITLADSTSFDSEEKAGHVTWMTALPLHYARNIGDAPLRIVLVEPKGQSFQQAERNMDPALVNPSSIAVKIENEAVRVMEATLPPGFRETMHTHPGYVMYILDGGSVRLNMADGSSRDSEFRSGAVFYSDPITHWAENTGSTTIRVMIVELRRP
jgi:quercetin dioxygenase-like cupin family protein